MTASVDDVIQLDPTNDWGPLLCIVDEIKNWGVRCYALVPQQRAEGPGHMYLRVEHDLYKVVGKAAWVARDE